MPPPDSWDPDQYRRFAHERDQPFWDLAGLLQPTDHPAMVDLGCGDGRLTTALAGRVGAATAVGIDHSEAMLADAGARADGTIRFELGDIGTWRATGAYDLVVANASLHWLPDHPTVLARWTAALRPGGQLAVQLPASADHPAMRLAGEVAAEWLDDPPPDPVTENVLPPEEYAALLEELGFPHQHVRLQVYANHLPSTDSVVEWAKGTALTRFRTPMGEERWEAYVEAYRRRVLDELGNPSPYLFLFKRILLWGQLDGD